MVVKEFNKDKTTTGPMSVHLETVTLKSGKYVLQLITGKGIETINLVKQ
jgi:hypothetical protein